MLVFLQSPFLRREQAPALQSKQCGYPIDQPINYAGADTVSKKAKYSKREVDDNISKWVKEGHDIPNSHELSKMGLTSRDVILRYYENWKEPFYIYKKLYEELGRH